MNVSKISVKILSSMNLNENSYNKSFNKEPFGLKLRPTLSQDTVTFTAKTNKVTKTLSKELKAAAARKNARALRDEKQINEAKLKPEKKAQTKKTLDNEDHKWGVSFKVAKRIYREILPAQEKVHNFVHRVFGDMVASELFPKNILLEVADRRKSPSSIIEKSSTRHWDTINEVYEKMTDLNGAKLVLNYKTGKQEAEKALDRLIPMIKTGQVTLKEIELQRPGAIENLKSKQRDPQEEYDYFSKNFLDRLEDAQEEMINGLECDVNKIKLIDRPLPKYTDGNYCALHLLLQLAGESRPFELQIMGPRVAVGKQIDDLRFKYFKGKHIDNKYNKLKALWEPLKSNENLDAKERFIQYCKDANLELRERELREYELQRIINRGTRTFISVQNYYLPPEYDLDNLLQIKNECDRVATVATKNLEAARKVKATKLSQETQNENRDDKSDKHDSSNKLSGLLKTLNLKLKNDN